jgi:hypothetical protein
MENASVVEATVYIIVQAHLPLDTKIICESSQHITGLVTKIPDDSVGALIDDCG